MKAFFAIIALCITASCVNTKGTISYAHDPALTCPAPVAMPENVAREFTRYGNDPMMMAFYKHYLDQQRQLAAAASGARCPPAFWAADDVAAKFRAYPPNHSMREFFKAYVAQQRAIDAYYAPSSVLVK